MLTKLTLNANSWYIPVEVLTYMQREDAERWRKLCELAAVEKDPTKLLELVREIDELLEKKDPRPPSQQTSKQSA